MQSRKKIPLVNDYFDLTIFLKVITKSLWIITVVMVLMLVASFMYLRYTEPSYNAISVLQINEEDQTSMLLKLDRSEDNSGLLKAIELLRSKEFLKRTFAKLPLDVGYYVEGTFLSHELYKSSPYVLEYKSEDKNFYNRKVYIEFDDIQNAKFCIELNGEKLCYEGKENEWIEIAGGAVRFSINDIEAIFAQNEDFKGYRYYFIVYNPEVIVNENEENLLVSIQNRSAQTIEISYTCNNALKAADVVNAIAEEYIGYEVDVKKESAGSILQFIENQLRVVYSSLDKTERSLQEFRKKYKINSSQLGSLKQLPLFTNKINEFEDELIAMEFELLTLKRVQGQIKDNGNINMYELIASLSGTKSEDVVSNALSSLQQLILERNMLLNDVTDNNLKVQLIDKQIANQKSLIADFIDSTIERLSAKKTDYEAKMNEYETKIFSDKGYDEIEYTKLERLYDINESFYTKLIEKKAEYLISQAGYVSQSTILEKAQTSRYQIYPIKKQVYPLFIFIGLVLCSLVIIIRYLLFNKITSISSIQNLTKASVVGSIPLYKHEIPVSQLLVDKNLNSMFTESFRTIRTNMQFMSHGEGTKIITVTSTIAGEGKTFIAINLAGIIAISKKKVIVLDCDLRKPRIHLGFNVDNDKGVSTILIGKHTIAECTRSAEIDGFDYITAGPVPPNPAELANGKTMEELIQKLELQYDVIIIDTPPVGIVTDSIANLQRANYPIYVMKANLSRRKFIDNINYLMETKKLDKLSVLLNGVDLNRNSYDSYGYGYGYYQEEVVEETSFLKRILKYNKN